MPNIIVIDKKFPEVLINGNTVKLTRKEFDVFSLLWDNKGRVCTRGYIYDSIWGVDHFASDNVISRIIKELRHKLQPFGLSDKIITRNGFGYYLDI